MSYTNYPSADNPQQQSPKDNRKLIYGLLITALIGTWAYIIFDKKQANETMAQMQTKFETVDSSKTAVENEYEKALARLDSLTGSNTQLQGQLSERQKDIEKLKANIRSELGKKNADLSKAKQMIGELNGKINDLLAQIEQLKAENGQLTVANQTLTTERDTLSSQKKQVEEVLATTQTEKAHIEDVGSTLHASNINITGINVKGSGKEKTTATAKRVDVFRISFDLDENRITPSGNKELFVCVYGPDGKPITLPSNGSGTFTTRDAGEKVFTNKVAVDYEQGKRVPVSFDWKPEEGKYQTGTYKVEIYQNGFKIGEGAKELKKGGIFG